MSAILVASPQFNIRLVWKYLQSICTKWSTADSSADLWQFSLILCLLSSYMTHLRVCACVGIRSKMALCFPAKLALCAVGYVHIRPSMNTSFSHYRCHQSSPIDSDVFFDILVDRFGPTGQSTCRRRRFQETFKGTRGGFGRGWKDALGLDLWKFP